MRHIDISRIFKTGMLSLTIAGLGWIVLGGGGSIPRSAADEPEIELLCAMIHDGQGQAALGMVAQQADLLGGWTPAPDNQIVYVDGMARGLRASVPIIDVPQAECGCPDALCRRLSDGLESCTIDFSDGQDEIRFGRWFFENPTPGGGAEPRPGLDDLLATYIEEAAHSWQEYYFETGGTVQGARTHLTLYEEAYRYQRGWEYQAQAYVLNLERAGVLALSDFERGVLQGNICDPEGRAHPYSGAIMPYGPPPGWLLPEVWPLAAPTPDEWTALCEGREG